VRDAEDVLALADGGSERHVLLLWLPRLPPPGHGWVRVLAAAAGAAAGRRREKEKARVRRNSERRGRGEERTEKWVEITPGVNSVQWAHSLEGLLQREWAWFSSMFPACAGRLVGRVLEVLAQHSTLRSISKQRNCLCQKKKKKTVHCVFSSRRLNCPPTDTLYNKFCTFPSKRKTNSAQTALILNLLKQLWA